MTTISCMAELKRLAKEWSESPDNTDLIPIFLDNGAGAWYIPSKRNPFYRMGEIHVPSKLFKEGKRHDLRVVQDLPVKVIAFIPKEFIADEFLKMSEEKQKKESKAQV